MDQLREECGVFGVYNQSEMDSAHMGYFALQALQHRGQDGCGMAASNGGPAQLIKNIGLVTDVFQHDGLGPLMGKKLLIGHVRYATSGATNVLNTQPLLMKFQGGFLALAHNGHLVNAPALSRYLREDGVLFQTDMDTELIAHLISRSRAKSMPDRIKEMMECVYGSYALVLMTRTHVYGVRDPWGIARCASANWAIPIWWLRNPVLLMFWGLNLSAMWSRAKLSPLAKKAFKATVPLCAKTTEHVCLNMSTLPGRTA